MNSVPKIIPESTRFGDSLFRPLQWYGRSISQLVTKPLPEDIFSAVVEVIARIVAFVALAILFPVLIVASPVALMGWAINHFSPSNHEISPGLSSHVPPASKPVPIVTVPSKNVYAERKNSSTNPISPSLSSASSLGGIIDDLPKSSATHKALPTAFPAQSVSESAASAQRGTAPNLPPQPASFIPFTPEIVISARDMTAELTALYDGLKELGGRDAQTLFNGIAEFQSLYEKHRNPDPFTVDEMQKIFACMDEITRNTFGMQLAQHHWLNFYRVGADSQGVILQPKDGNCWLHTSILGLKHIDHPSLGDETYLTLRPKIVDWMRRHYDSDVNLQRFITDAIEAHKAVETHRLREERDSLKGAIAGKLIPAEDVSQAEARLNEYEKLQEDLTRFTLNDYFSHMEKVGSHGTRAELYAVSRMFEVNVAIWRDIPARGDIPSRLTKDYDEQIEHPSAEHTINTVLTQEGNHFNYRIPQRENDS